MTEFLISLFHPYSSSHRQMFRKSFEEHLEHASLVRSSILSKNPIFLFCLLAAGTVAITVEKNVNGQAKERIIVILLDWIDSSARKTIISNQQSHQSLIQRKNRKIRFEHKRHNKTVDKHHHGYRDYVR